MHVFISQTDPINYPLDSFYLFGWCGDLDPEARKAAGIELYNELKKVVAQRTINGIKPPITLFTHSHGGGVVLNMKHAFEADTDPLYVDLAIFIACPVKEETKQYIHSVMFKDIHSYHSDSDVIQRIDPQGLHPLMAATKKAHKAKSLKPFKGVWSELLAQ